MPKNEKTSRRVGKIASKLLRSKSTSKRTKIDKSIGYQ